MTTELQTNKVIRRKYQDDSEMILIRNDVSEIKEKVAILIEYFSDFKCEIPKLREQITETLKEINKETTDRIKSNGVLHAYIDRSVLMLWIKLATLAGTVGAAFVFLKYILRV